MEACRRERFGISSRTCFGLSRSRYRRGWEVPTKFGGPIRFILPVISLPGETVEQPASGRAHHQAEGDCDLSTEVPKVSLPWRERTFNWYRGSSVFSWR